MKNIYLISIGRGVLFFFISLCWPAMMQAQYQVTGSASVLNDTCFTITPAINIQNGAVWSSNTINLNESFELRASIFLGNNTGGADGMTFTIQPSATAVGSGTVGGMLGIAGIVPSLIIEFDTYQNSEYGDPFFHHTALHINGSINHNLSSNLAGPISLLTNNGPVSNGNWHDVLIQWEVNSNNTQTIRMFFNCVLRIQHTANFIGTVFSGNANQRFGFTGATGGLNNLQQVCIEGFNATGISIAQYDICEGETIQLNTAYPGTGFQWSPATGLSDATVASPIAAPDSTITYTVVYTGLCNENYTDSITVIVNPEAEISIFPPAVTEICTGDTVQLIVLSSVAGTAFTWWPADGLSCLDCPLPLASPGVTTTYYVSGTCGNMDSITITVQDPVFELFGDVTICQGQSIQLGDVNDPGTTYSWVSSSGETIPPIGDPVVSPQQTTTYTLTATAGNCSVTESMTITVIELPELTASSSAEGYCQGDLIALTAQSEITSGLVWTGPGLLSNAGVSVHAMPAVTGQITYTVSTVYNGCPLSASVEISVDEPPVFQIIGDTTICGGESISLGSSHNPDYQYTWSPAGIAPVGNPTVQPQQVQNTYTVQVTNGGCSKTSSVNVSVLTLQVSAPPDTSLCEGNAATLSVSVSGTGGTGNQIIWTPADGLSCTDCSTAVASPEVTTTYTVSYSLNGACEVSDQVTVSVGPAISVTIADDATIAAGTTAPLSSVVTTGSGADPGDLTYLWIPPDGLSCSDCPNPVASPAQTTTYSLQVTSSYMCTAISNSVTIAVELFQFAIPSAFTPGGTVNPRFTVFFPDGAPFSLRSFRVYNRWGHLIYDSPSPQGWDGSYNGSFVPQDVYVYIIELQKPDGSVEKLTGDVTVLR